jgi:hypothetical protein
LARKKWKGKKARAEMKFILYRDILKEAGERRGDKMMETQQRTKNM